MIDTLPPRAAVKLNTVTPRSDNATDATILYDMSTINGAAAIASEQCEVCNFASWKYWNSQRKAVQGALVIFTSVQHRLPATLRWHVIAKIINAAWLFGAFSCAAMLCVSFDSQVCQFLLLLISVIISLRKDEM